MSAFALSSTLSFADRVSHLLERVDYRPARSDEEREAIYRLRYAAYLREGAIAPSFVKTLTDSFDESPNAWCFGVFIDGRLASSVRLHVSTQDIPEMPAAAAFPDVVSPALESGYTIIDPTRFVADGVCAKDYPELPYVTLRLGYLAAEHFGADFVLASVRAEHQAFYKRVFGHRVVCEPRPYLTLIKPLSLMQLHYPSTRRQIVQRYPFFRSTLFERRMLFERGDDVPGFPPARDWTWSLPASI
jgi:hypothetical protein